MPAPPRAMVSISLKRPANAPQSGARYAAEISSGSSSVGSSGLRLMGEYKAEGPPRDEAESSVSHGGKRKQENVRGLSPGSYRASGVVDTRPGRRRARARRECGG